MTVSEAEKAGASDHEEMMSDVSKNTIASIPDEVLLRRAVKSARARSYRKGALHSRWIAVADVFCLGGTFSVQLCERFGLDPHEAVKR
jgi:hypothetical protein